MYYFNCILLIDDDPVNNAVTEELLKQLYFSDQIKTVMSGVEGIDFIQEFYNQKQLAMTVTPGEYEIWYGSSSSTKDLKLTKLLIK